MKNSFIMFNNYKDFFDKLTNEEAGELIKAIIDYCNGKDVKELKSVRADCYFTVIKQHLDSNSEKYEKKVEKNKENVSKRWNKQQDTTVSSGKNENTKDTTVSFGINEDTKNTTGKNKIPKDTTVSSGINEDTKNTTGKNENTKNTTVSSGIKSYSDNDNDIDNDIDIDSDNVINNNDSCSEQRVATEPEPPEKQEIVQNEADMTEMVEPEDIKIAPNELQGLFLYEKDVRLVKLWPELISAWKLAFPGIDIVAEVKAAHAWEVANPKKRKVDRARFLQNWMAKSQDKYGGRIFGGKRNNSTNYDFNER